MFSSRQAFENDLCPVRDELLGQMYRANENGLCQLVASVSPDVRAMLALFCYRRSHLYSLALAIAGSCSEQELVHFGGRVGTTLYALSREPVARAAPSAWPALACWTGSRRRDSWTALMRRPLAATESCGSDRRDRRSRHPPIGSKALTCSCRFGDRLKSRTL